MGVMTTRDEGNITFGDVVMILLMVGGLTFWIAASAITIGVVSGTMEIRSLYEWKDPAIRPAPAPARP